MASAGGGSGRDAGGDSGDEGDTGGPAGSKGGAAGGGAGSAGIAGAGARRLLAASDRAIDAGAVESGAAPQSVASEATSNDRDKDNKQGERVCPSAPDRPAAIAADKPLRKLERDTALPSDKAKAAMLRQWNELQPGEDVRMDMAPGVDLPRREVLLAIRGQAPKHWVSFYQLARGMRSHKIHQLFLVSAKGDYEDDDPEGA